jgi:hypothetical protein
MTLVLNDLKGLIKKNVQRNIDYLLKKPAILATSDETFST